MARSLPPRKVCQEERARGSRKSGDIRFEEEKQSGHEEEDGGARSQIALVLCQPADSGASVGLTADFEVWSVRRLDRSTEVKRGVVPYTLSRDKCTSSVSFEPSTSCR